MDNGHLKLKRRLVDRLHKTTATDIHRVATLLGLHGCVRGDDGNFVLGDHTHAQHTCVCGAVFCWNCGTDRTNDGFACPVCKRVAVH